MAVRRAMQAPEIVRDVGFAGPAVDVGVKRRQGFHLDQARLVVELHHRGIWRVAGDDGRVKPVVVIGAAAPGDAFGLHGDIRIGFFEVSHQCGGVRCRVVEMVPPAHGGFLLRMRQRERGGGQGGGGDEQLAAFHDVPPFYVWWRQAARTRRSLPARSTMVSRWAPSVRAKVTPSPSRRASRMGRWRVAVSARSR